MLVGVLAIILFTNCTWANPTQWRDESYEAIETDTVHEGANDEMEKRAGNSVYYAICYYTCQVAKEHLCDRYCGWSPARAGK